MKVLIIQMMTKVLKKFSTQLTGIIVVVKFKFLKK